MNRLSTSWGEYTLARHPEDPRDQLRAWDASDEYLLRHLAEAEAEDAVSAALRGAVVVVGDRWGALTTALAAHRTRFSDGADSDGAGAEPAGPPPVQISDSYLGLEATRANLARNEAGEARLLSTQDAPPDRIDVLLVRVPKSLALLEDQLQRLAPAVHADTVVIGTGMVKEIHTSTLKLFERIIGPTRTSLAEKKARLVLATPDPALARTPSPWPRTYQVDADGGLASGLTVVNHAGVFCAERLDVGTRFFCQNLPTGDGPFRAVDLGCGNGVIGTALALANPRAELLFTDESHQAVASAEATYRKNGAANPAAFAVADALADVEPGSVDLVLSNPPFHSHQAMTDATAWRMFTTARRALREGGELWIVGNRHLGYHLKLKRLYGNCELVAGDAKFVVLRAVKR